VRLAIVALVLAACPDTVFGQTATLSGRVMDDTGAVLPGVIVSLRGPSDAVVETVTDDAGKLYAENLKPRSVQRGTEVNRSSRCLGVP
jgi:protocatechuate 3,4-dioxygenase beta subunit